MAYVSILIAGYLLGIFSVLILAALYLLHRPRYVAPTKHRRQGLQSVKQEPQPMPNCKVAKDAEVGGIRYEHLGMTGLEE